jgi:antitoxin (DNA-binding transcriptional repressor) of toxin-antitoxin stability system
MRVRDIDVWLAFTFGWYNAIMNTINIQDIQRDPAAFLRRMEAGESMIVLRDECPLAEIKPLPQFAGGERPYGLCAGEFTVPDDFDDPLPEEILKEFEGQ